MFIKNKLSSRTRPLLPLHKALGVQHLVGTERNIQATKPCARGGILHDMFKHFNWSVFENAIATLCELDPGRTKKTYLFTKKSFLISMFGKENYLNHYAHPKFDFYPYKMFLGHCYDISL